VKKSDVDRWGRYFDARNGGLGVEAACRRSRLSLSSAYRFERGDPSSGGLEAAEVLGVKQVGGVFVDAPLSVEARRALDDFAFFRLRYFGRRSTTWQAEAACEVAGCFGYG
jgi:hypothetical protein